MALTKHIKQIKVFVVDFQTCVFIGCEMFRIGQTVFLPYHLINLCVVQNKIDIISGLNMFDFFALF